MSQSVGENVHNYDRDAFFDELLAALEQAGLAQKTLTARDLAPLDQFHSRGFEATIELAQALSIKPETRVLDVGSGLGGPARYLAQTYGCHVQGIDLTPSYVKVATYLAERSNLADKVSFVCANALSLPFADATFDLVWTQHVAMNIENRSALYGEISRVLKPGGKLAIYDVVAGPNGPVYFPVPWSTLAETSFLMTPDAMRAVLLKEGFKILSWLDRTEAGIIWFADLQKRMGQAQAAPPLGLNLAVGPDFGQRAANLGRSLKEGRAGLLEAIVEKP